MPGTKFPFHGTIGIALILAFWYVNWFFGGLRSHWAFFPLWLGYIMAVDGLAVRFGRPSLVRDARRFALLFVLSVAVWWLFEAFNTRVDYWRYDPSGVFPPLEFAWWSSVCFSTVVPAVFATANLFAAIPWFQRHHLTMTAGLTDRGRIAFLVLGVLMLIFTLILPQYGMAFLWMSLFFILDPINHRLGNASILRMTAVGDWRLVIILFAATLVCGFFWEMWNYYSYPKWVYTFPFLDKWPIFEMPIAGYLGYLPFGLELYAFVALLGPRLNVEIPAFTSNASGG